MLAWAHENDYSPDLQAECEQHYRFTSPRGVIHVCTWHGSISHGEAKAIALKWALGDFKRRQLKELTLYA